MNSDLNLLVVFQHIYKSRNLTKAAESLGLTQSAVSQGLGRLRLEFNDKLFFRVPEGMEPTARAHEIAIPVSAALRSVEMAFQTGNKFDPKTSDEYFKIGMEDIDIGLISPSLINHFQKVAPNIKLKFIPLNSEKYTDLLDQGTINIAIDAVKKSLPQRFSSALLFHDELVVISKKNHPKIKDKLTLKEFFSLPHLEVDLLGLEKDWIEPLFIKHGKKRTFNVSVKHLLAVPFVIKETNLIATLPLTLMEFLKDIKGISIYSFPAKLPLFEICVIWHQRIEGNLAYDWIIGEIKKVCKKIDVNKMKIKN